MSTEAASFASFLGIFAGAIFIIFAIWAVLVIVGIISLWKIFTKAGQPGWAAIIPVYNYYILTKVARVNVIYFVILLVPTLITFTKVELPSVVDQAMTIAVIIAYILIVYNLCKQFGKGVGYTLGMIFLPFIFYPMLAFGDSVYQEEVDSLNEDVSVAPTESIQSESVPAESAPAESPVTTGVDQTAPTSTQQ